MAKTIIKKPIPPMRRPTVSTSVSTARAPSSESKSPTKGDEELVLKVAKILRPDLYASTSDLTPSFAKWQSENRPAWEEKARKIIDLLRG